MATRTNRGPALYAVAVGLLMLVMWGFLIAAGEVPELATGEAEIYFHLTAEFLTAFLLILGGAAVLLRRNRLGRLLTVGFGMLLYTLIVSPGYYVDLGKTPIVVMFAVLFVLTVISLGRVLLAD